MLLRPFDVGASERTLQPAMGARETIMDLMDTRNFGFIYLLERSLDRLNF